MENANKRYYSRCMYGNFKPSYEFYDQSGPRHHFRHKKLVWAVFVALAALFLIFLVGCKPKQVIVEKEKLVYVTKDSIVHRDSTVYVPVEVYKDYSSLLDTLFLSTSIAKAWSTVDTNKMLLVGEIRNIKALEVKYIEVEKWHTKDSLVYKDKEVPVPVEVIKTKTPKWAWITLIWTLICLVYVGFKIYLKFWKP